jgi:hypothetical protein
MTARQATRQPAAAPQPRGGQPTEPEFLYLYLSAEPLTPPNPLSAVVPCSADRLQRIQRALAWLYVPATQGGDLQQVFLVYRNQQTWQSARRSAQMMLRDPPPVFEQLIAELRPSGLVTPAAVESLSAALLQARSDSQLSESWRWSAAMWRGRLMSLQERDPASAADDFAAAQQLAPPGTPEDLAATAAWIEVLVERGHVNEAGQALDQLQRRCTDLMDSAAGRQVQRLVQERNRRSP